MGITLLVAAARLLWKAQEHEGRAAPPVGIALASGAGLGLLSGLTGVGGGIFLSPLLLLLRWANMRATAVVSAAFILVNSIAGLAGATAHARSAGSALVGSELAVRRLAPVTLRRVLGVVLVIAGIKLLLTA